MQVFSKLAKNQLIDINLEKNKKKDNKQTNRQKLSNWYDEITDKSLWREFIKNCNLNLNYLKLIQLKEIAKSNRLKISGTKQHIISRINEHFSKIKNIIKIQSLFRMKLVKLYLTLCGPAIRDRSICVNDKDFYNLDSLDSIHFSEFFSFKDKQNFIYGFDLHSLLILMKKPGNVKNPYNREVIEFKVIKDISVMAKLNKYIFPKIHNQHFIDNDENQTTIRERILDKMRIIRNKTDNQRIEELFYEIDSLGNYTNSRWFKNLDLDGFVNFIKYIWEIWNQRSNMPTITKRRICPYFNPFQDGLQHMNMRNRENIENIEIVRRTAITIMENIIYTGINNEYKQIGTLHILTALTHVSIPARASLPYLFESVSF